MASIIQVAVVLGIIAYGLSYFWDIPYWPVVTVFSFVYAISILFYNIWFVRNYVHKYYSRYETPFSKQSGMNFSNIFQQYLDVTPVF